MTDALSEWSFRSIENGMNDPGIIKGKLTRNTKVNSFTDWIEHLHNKHENKNGDTTIIWIKLY
jgi:hypothetical protein